MSTTSQVAQAFYDQGLAYTHSYMWIEAVRSFQQALRRDPNLAVAHVGLSAAYVELVKPDQAKASLVRAREQATRLPTHDRRHIELGVLRMAAEETPSDAAKLTAYRRALDDALAAFPSDVELWLLRGMAESSDPAERGQGNTASSVRFYERALALSPDHFAARHYLTHAYENTGRTDEALRDALAYARLAPAVPHAHHMFGHNLRRTGRTSEAIVELRTAYERETGPDRAADIPPEYDWHHAHNLDVLAASHQSLGQIKSAEALLKKSFDLPTALIVQAFNKHEWPAFLLARGRAQEALAAARTLATHPAALVSGIGQVMVGHAHLALAQHAEAANAINSALTSFKRAGPAAALAVPHFEALQAEYFLRTGAREKGQALFREAQRKFRALPGPDGWSQALFRLEAMARSARDLSDWTLAEQAATALREHDPSYPGTWYALGLIAEHNGDREAAVQAFRNAAAAWIDGDSDLTERLDVQRRLASLAKD